MLKRLFWSWLILIIIVSSIPFLWSPKISIDKPGFNFEFRLDYIFHFMEYFILVTLLCFWKFKYFHKFKINILYVILIILFSIFEEFHQKIIPGRVFNPVDLCYDLMGIASGFIIFFIRRRIAVQKSR